MVEGLFCEPRSGELRDVDLAEAADCIQLRLRQAELLRGRTSLREPDLRVLASMSSGR